MGRNGRRVSDAIIVSSFSSQSGKVTISSPLPAVQEFFISSAPSELTAFFFLHMPFTLYNRLFLTMRTCTVFPQISTRALISYRASKTRCLNETRSLFEHRRLFLIAYFEGTVDLCCSLIAAHLRSLWELHTGDLYPRQQWASFALQEHFLRNSRVVFLHLSFQKTLARR